MLKGAILNMFGTIGKEI